MQINFPTLKQLILNADANGKLIIDKHNPDKVSTIVTPFRTVVSKDVADNVVSFFNGEDYTVDEYYNNDYPLSPLYFTIKPNSGSSFSVASSGVTGNVPTSAMDLLVIVSGGTQGIHMYGTSSSILATDIASGKLTNHRNLK